MRTLPVVFTGAILLNAALLFLVEPMFGRMVLPLLGGTANVWNTCLLFFQAALLGGYLYAHALARWCAPRMQAIVHVALLALAALTLPVAVARGWTPPNGTTPVLWLLGLLSVSLGAPFVLLSAGAPLLQHWFAQTAHPAARNPYFLYAASNVGSLVALLGYPLLVEPRLRLAEQSAAWAAAYGGLLALVGACAVLAARHLAPAAPADRRDSAHDADEARPGVTAPERLRWTLLAFAPSSLLLGVTTYLTTDVAAIPLFWVVPLVLYLLTFVLAFATRPPVSRTFAARLQLLVAVPLVLQLFWNLPLPGWTPFLLHLTAFFCAALLCHTELAEARPAARHLTEFFVWVSVGGALGGAFNVLVAPLIFPTVIEYGVAVALVCLLRPTRAPGRRWLDVALPAALTVGLVALAPVARQITPVLLVAGSVAIGGALLAFRGRAVRFGLGVAGVLLAGAVSRGGDGATVLAARSFFGVSRVRADSAAHAVVLLHGSTMHGAQSTDAAGRRVPSTYYNPAGPLGNVVASRGGRAPLRVAVVGLGAGAAAGYAKPGDAWTFYEIDAVVARIAGDRRYFTYLADAPVRIPVVLGDARLSLRDAPPGGYDLILLDAFSSDAIPTHLLTREAVRLYLTKLAPAGLLAFHITNKFLDLGPVLAAAARDVGAVAVARGDAAFSGDTSATRAAALQHMPSRWAVLARRPADLGALAADPRWAPLAPDPDVRVWTDDFSNVLRVIRLDRPSWAGAARP